MTKYYNKMWNTNSRTNNSYSNRYRTVRQTAENAARVTYKISGKTYERVMEQAQSLFHDVKDKDYYNTTATSNERLAGCAAEAAFGLLLMKAGIKSYQPTNAAGKTHCDFTGADFGDFKINGVVYDVKGSMKHANVSAKYKTTRAKYIDAIIGSHIIIDSINKTMVVYFYGVMDYKDVVKYDEQYIKACQVIKPHNFKPFPFEFETDLYISK